MKKLIILIAILLATSTLANAQMRPDAKPGAPGINPGEVAAMNTQYVTLLEYQNKLLNRRVTALAVSAAGACIYEVGNIMYSAKVAANQDPTTGSTIALIGAATIGVGGIWAMINEVNLIGTQKKINEHLMLRYSPGGIALEF